MPQLNQVTAYAEAMASAGRGYGFYDTASVQKVRPGACGYINAAGRWSHIVHLTDSTAIAGGGYTSPAQLVESDPTRSTWGPITSTGVTSTVLALGAGGTDIAATGIGANVRVKYSTSRDIGAVLLCNTPVFWKGLEHASVLKKWGKANVRKIIENVPDVEEFGFEIVQGVSSCEDVYAYAWNGDKSETYIGGLVTAGNVADGNVTIQYQREAASAGWVHPMPMPDQAPEQRVIFFQGLHFKVRKMTKQMTWASSSWRGGDNESDEEEETFISAGEGNAAAYEIEMTIDDPITQ